jgi:tRNA A-37 threonylcarbamoyl transferase component Bud32
MGTSTDRFSPGSRIDDYIVECDLGDSYEAVHLVLPRRVRLEIATKPHGVRMMRGACILEGLQHPGVPRIYEVGLLRTAMENRPWVASELIAGEVLTGPLSATQILEVVRDVAGVLAYAHDRGVVHRDLRADSIVCTDGSRGYPIVITNWTEARADTTELARAGDILALGEVALSLLPADAPARIKMMIDDLVVANPLNRPSAAEVRARAKLILETLDGEDDVIEEQIELVELPRTFTPPERSSRIRWTPALGVQTPPKPQGIAIGVLKPRS